MHLCFLIYLFASFRTANIVTPKTTTPTPINTHLVLSFLGGGGVVVGGFGSGFGATTSNVPRVVPVELPILKSSLLPCTF
jgi:hypothetical protein